MKLNTTDQTTTFPCPVNKLKGRLNDNIGLQWNHRQFGNLEITKENIPWIMANVKTSMFNNKRCYIYNKAFYEAILTQNTRHKLVAVKLLKDLILSETGQQQEVI